MIHHDDMIEEVETNIDGRPLELTGPQIYLFASKELGSAYGLASTTEERKASLLMKEILPTLTHFLKKKGQLTEKTLQSVVCDALKHLTDYEPKDKLIHRTVMEVITGRTREIMQIAYDIIYDEVKKLTDATDPFNPDEQAFYSADYGKITHRQILNICKNPFRGEPDRIDNTKVKVKALTFDKEIINKVGKIFEAITEIKILQPEDEAEEDRDTLATEQQNFSTYTEKEENKESIQSEQLSQNIQENNNNHI